MMELEKVRRYQQLREESEEQKKRLSEINKKLDMAKKDLVEEMALEECSVIGLDGYNYYLQTKTHYSKKAEQEEILFSLLRENGLGDIVKETVNPRTLESTLKNFVEEKGELPEDFEEVLHVYEMADILRRKA